MPWLTNKLLIQTALLLPITSTLIWIVEQHSSVFARNVICTISSILDCYQCFVCNKQRVLDNSSGLLYIQAHTHATLEITRRLRWALKWPPHRFCSYCQKTDSFTRIDEAQRKWHRSIIRPFSISSHGTRYPCPVYSSSYIRRVCDRRRELSTVFRPHATHTLALDYI